MLRLTQVLRQERSVQNALKHIKALQIVQNAAKPEEKVYNDLYENLPENVKSFFTQYPPNLKYKKTFTSSLDPLKNPFLPSINPLTQVWETPDFDKNAYKELYHACYRYGIVDFLPRPESLTTTEELSKFVEPVTNNVIDLTKNNKLSRNLKMVKEYTTVDKFFEEKVEDINNNVVTELQDVIIKRKEREERQLARKKQMDDAIANMDNIIVNWKKTAKKKELYMNRQKANIVKKMKLFD